MRKTPHEERARETARILLEIDAVEFSADEPFTLTSGRKSPVYIDCRHIIAFPRARSRITEMSMECIAEEIGYESIDVIAGGETAGIPFAAWIADGMSLPMMYVRKKPKEFGRMSQIEGGDPKGKRVLLVEDLATDGGSKVAFMEALRGAKAEAAHVFVIFFYDIFPEAREKLLEQNIELHYLTTWHDVLAVCEEERMFPKEELRKIRASFGKQSRWGKTLNSFTRFYG